MFGYKAIALSEGTDAPTGKVAGLRSGMRGNKGKELPVRR